MIEELKELKPFAVSLAIIAGLFWASIVGAAPSLTYLGNASSTALSANVLCLTADTCRTTWPTGAAFPFTTTSYGVSTSTTLGLLNGFLSTASSTFSAGFNFTTATGTSATTTNLFSTTASSTNLFSSLLSVGGNALNVIANGNVGIGTTNPQTKLHVRSIDTAGAVASTLLRLDRDTASNVGDDNYLDIGYGTDTYARIAAHVLAGGDSNLSFWTATAGTPSEKVRILANGNVGIGTTVPNVKLEVVGPSGTGISDGTTVADFVATGAETARLRIAVDNATGDAFMNVYATTGAYGQNLNLMTNGGNVGIGTTTPQTKLSISQSSATGTGLELDVPSTSANYAKFSVAGAPKWYMYPSATGDLTFYDTANRVTLQSGGNVGIGTTGPAEKLHTRVNANWAARFDGAVGGGGNYGGVFIGSRASGKGTVQGQDGAGNVGDLLLQTEGGNVGIGTTNPGALVDIYNATTGVLRLSGGNTTAQIDGYSIGNNVISRIETQRQDDNTSGLITFYTALSGSLTRRMTITNTGNVGIGTTAPGANLDIYEATTDTPLNINRAANTGNGMIKFQTGGTNDWILGQRNDSTSDFRLYSYGTGTDVFSVLRATGNVGIGTTGPTDNLDVYDASSWAVIDADGASGGEIRLQRAGTTYADIYANDAAGFIIGAPNGIGDIFFQPGGTTKVTMLDGGNVGIGTTGPLSKLDILTDGSSQSSRISLAAGSIGANRNRINIYTQASDLAFANRAYIDAVQDSGASINLGFRTNGTENMTLENGGDVGIGTTTPWGQLSASSTSAFPTLAIEQKSTGPAAVFLGGNVGVGTSTPASLLHVSAGASATTTVDFGAQSTSAKTCFNVRNNTGAETSFYFVGTTMVVEANRCR